MRRKAFFERQIIADCLEEDDLDRYQQIVPSGEGNRERECVGKICIWVLLQAHTFTRWTLDFNCFEPIQLFSFYFLLLLFSRLFILHEFIIPPRSNITSTTTRHPDIHQFVNKFLKPAQTRWFCSYTGRRNSFHLPRRTISKSGQVRVETYFAWGKGAGMKRAISVR